MRLKIRKSGADTAFLIYFTIMACLYTINYVQLAAQLGIIAYVFFHRAKKVPKRLIAQVFFLMKWFGTFVFVAFLSTRWAYAVQENSYTLSRLFRILVIAICMGLYIDSYERCIAVLKSYIFSSVIMGIVVMLTTPFSQYGQADISEGFGSFIGQQRNTVGAIMAFTAALCYILWKWDYFPFGKSFAAFTVVVLVCSGSRGAILQFAICCAVYILLQDDAKKMFRYISVAVFAGAILIVLMQSIPFLSEMIWKRIENMFLTVLGIKTDADGSAESRELYKVLAFEMFKNKPFLGYGVDGFYCYLDHVKIVGGKYLRPKYSHCNFAELASCFGVVGLAVWYIPVMQTLVRILKQSKMSEMAKAVTSLFISMIIADYARIPWTTHINMYQYFGIMLLSRYLQPQMPRNRSVESADEKERGVSDETCDCNSL